MTPEINPELDDLELRATQGLETYGDEVPAVDEIKSPHELLQTSHEPRREVHGL